MQRLAARYRTRTFLSILVLSLLSSSLVFSPSLYAQTPKELPLEKNDSGALLSGVTFSRTSRTFLGSFTWSGRELLAGKRLQSLMLAVFDQKKKVRLTPWIDFDGPLTFYNGEMTGKILVNDETALEVISALRDSRIVLSLDQEADSSGEYPVTHFIDLRALCARHSDLFLDIDTEKKGCR